MKIQEEQKQFTPLTITFDTPEEVAHLLRRLFLPNKYVLDYPDMTTNLKEHPSNNAIDSGMFSAVYSEAMHRGIFNGK